MRYNILINPRTDTFDYEKYKTFVRNLFCYFLCKTDPDGKALYQRLVPNYKPDSAGISQVRFSKCKSLQERSMPMQKFLDERLFIYKLGDKVPKTGIHIAFGDDCKFNLEANGITPYKTYYNINILYKWYRGKRKRANRTLFTRHVRFITTDMYRLNGVDVVDVEPEIWWIKDEQDTKTLVDRVKRTKLCCYDYETTAKDKDLETSALVKKHALDYNKSVPTTLQVSYQAGMGAVIPMFHFQSWFNIGKDDILKFYREIDPKEDDKWPEIDPYYMSDYEEDIYIEKNGEFICKYNKKLAPFDGEFATNLFNNWQTCIAEGIDNYLFDRIFPILSDMFALRDVKFVGHNFSFDGKVSWHWGFVHKINIFDTLQIEHDIKENDPKSLDDLTDKYAPQLSGYGEGMSYENDLLRKLGKYGAIDTHITALAFFHGRKKLAEDARSYNVYESLHRPSLITLTEMEYRGAHVDETRLTKGIKETTAFLEEIHERLVNEPLVKRYVKARNEYNQKQAIRYYKAQYLHERRKLLAKFEEKMLEHEKNGKEHLVRQYVEKYKLVKGNEVYDPKFKFKDLRKNVEKINDIKQRGIVFFDQLNFNSSDQLGELLYEDPYEHDEIPTSLSSLEKSKKFSGDVYVEHPILEPVVKDGKIVDVKVISGGKGVKNAERGISGYRYSIYNTKLLVQDTTGSGAILEFVTNKNTKTIKDVVVINGGSGYSNPRIDSLMFKSPSHVHKYYYNYYGYDMEAISCSFEKRWCSRKRSVEGTDEQKNEYGYFPTTDKNMLKELDADWEGDLISTILEYRAVSKILNTYLIGYFDLKDVNNRVHTGYSLVKSMRLSSKNPNLQNIPSRTKIKSVKKASKLTKQVYTCPSDDYVFFSADYSQMELRVAAYMWNVLQMIHIYKTGGDIHAHTGAKVAGYSFEEFKKLAYDVYKDYRQKAKAVNFSFLFGALAKKFMQLARQDYEIHDMTYELAQKARNDFFELFPEILKGHEKVRQEAFKYGYIRTLFGSKRHLEDIYALEKFGIDASPAHVCGQLVNDKGLDRAIKSAAFKVLGDERVAKNSPIQGTAGQIMVFALNLIRDRAFILGLKGSIINSVHDSALGYAHKDDGIEFLKLIKYTCENPLTKEYFNFDFGEVPLKVDIEIGEDWGTMVEVECDVNDVDLTAYNSDDLIGKSILWKNKRGKVKKYLENSKILVSFTDEDEELDKLQIYVK